MPAFPGPAAADTSGARLPVVGLFPGVGPQLPRMFDLAILGSGFAGSLLALVARRLGRTVLLLERGRHPRFAIGESSSPLANLLLEEIARRWDLPRLVPLTTYGAWKRTYPRLAVGLKRGFSFYAHTPNDVRSPVHDRTRQLLVAASPSDALADTHWYRPDFDAFLVDEAAAAGAEFVDRTRIERAEFGPAGVSLAGTREGCSVRYQARWLFDATGPRGALSRLLGLVEAPFPDFPHTEALYTHFAHAPRFEAGGVQSENPHCSLLTSSSPPPYPPDDAAVHHLFPGGWVWVLRFENGLTSAGVVLERSQARELRLEEGEGAWRRVLHRFHALHPFLECAEPTLPFVHQPCVPYRTAVAAGEGWTLLPGAAAVVDPLFSTGFPLSLLGIQRYGTALEEDWGTARWATRLAHISHSTLAEADHTATLVGACYKTFAAGGRRNSGIPGFPTFTSLSMLYFVAASYSEMARRLGHPARAEGFLLRETPAFRNAFTSLTARAHTGYPATPAETAALLAPFNVAGLCDATKGNWYSVALEDVVRNADKLGVSAEAVRAYFTKLLG